MLITEGFERAKSLLSREVPADHDTISPSLKQGIKAVFGEELTVEQAVKKIIDDVRSKGDNALIDYTFRIDKIRLNSLEISRSAINNAYQSIDKELLSSLELAASRIRSYHDREKNAIGGGFTGEESGMLIHPLERVGIYVPGGTASYPSSVLMTAVPAKVAGVKEVIMATPPGKDGSIPLSVLVAADISGVDRVFSIGGAQAIAALTYGTESIPRVDKICGPGNIFVVMAKKLVYGMVDIDGLAGPSEVLIIADETTDPAYCAADLLAQAEHDPLASAILVTTSRKLADEVNQEVERQLQGLERNAIVSESLSNRGTIAVVANLDEAIELANLYAPEHLCLAVANAADYVKKIHNAGCIFVGEDSTVALGDYIAGPSHVLPTGGTARFGSPLNIMDFLKFTSLVTISKNSLKQIGQAASTIARAEGLEAHARAVEKRLKGI
ncbi:histidinol dehydrogenase [Chloroflexota bacterium]